LNLETSVDRFPMNTDVHIDALLPGEMATKAAGLGVRKAQMDGVSTLVLAVLAGSFIAFGAIFSTTLVAGASEFLPFGLTRIVAGLGFSLGLILVVVSGAELFTGNNLIVMAWASRLVTTRLMLQNWAIVYFGNLIGALGTVALMFASGQYRFGAGAVGAAALAAANAKMGYGFVQAMALGILCNVLVCLAVWMTYSGRSVIDKVVVITFPVTAFVACGFEHSIANMYYLPMALSIREGAPLEFWAAIGKTPAEYSALTLDGFLMHNLLPVTLGNIIGGALAVAGVYWFVYLRGKAQDPGA